MKSPERMAANIEKLLRLSRLKVDEAKAGLAAVQVARQSTETALAQLDHAYLQECRRAERQPCDASSSMLAPFAERMRIKRANMLATLAQYEAQEQALRADLEAAQVEINKLDHVVGLVDANQSRKAATANQHLLDDIATKRWQNRA